MERKKKNHHRLFSLAWPRNLSGPRSVLLGSLPPVRGADAQPGAGSSGRLPRGTRAEQSRSVLGTGAGGRLPTVRDHAGCAGRPGRLSLTALSRQVRESKIKPAQREPGGAGALLARAGPFLLRCCLQTATCLTWQRLHTAGAARDCGQVCGFFPLGPDRRSVSSARFGGVCFLEVCLYSLFLSGEKLLKK